MSEKTMVWFNSAGCEHEDVLDVGRTVCQRSECHLLGGWVRVEPGYVPPPENADVLVTIRRGGKRWVQAAKAMRRSETAMGFFATVDPDRPGEWQRDVVAYMLYPLPMEDGEVVP